MSSHGSRPRRSTPGPSRAGSSSDRGGSFRGYKSDHSRNNSGSRFSDRKNNRDALEPPLRDETLIKETYHDINIPASIADDPKFSLTEFASQIPGTTLSFKCQVGTLNKQRLWRSTVTLESDLAIVGEGDSPTKEDSEKLAALSVVYQLVQCGLLNDQGKVIESLLPQSVPQEIERTLSDNKTKVDYDCARGFIGHYIQKLGSGREDIEYNPVVGSNEESDGVWEAVMTSCGSRLGSGCGPTKALAQKACYVDVAVHLEARDPNLWETYVEEEKTGRDLRTTPPVHFSISESLEDEIYELCTSMKKSTLYENALKLRDSPPQIIPGAKMPFRRSPELPSFEEKDRILKERREKYLTDPTMRFMRASRAALPITIHARELLDHIRDNDVTICMAATGAGKTTQTPQLILDDYIDRGEGSRCNIVCTQPYQLAAISAARRVAMERGERLSASVGYRGPPRGELPEERGSITFCTTPTFLEWMQSTSNASDTSAKGHSLDGVTHVVADEIHERAADTDLLLLVLKRLLVDRRAKGKPIKVILMSATIDPTLIQQYFPDEQGLPSKVIEVPCRGFPVKKHFLDEFVSDLNTTPAAAETLAQDSVADYLCNELGPATPSLCSPRFHTNRDKNEGLEVPNSLIALTIVHVLRSTEDGHILTFLPGRDEIRCVRWYITNRVSRLAVDFGDPAKWSIHLLDSAISVVEREEIFNSPPGGVRKIILATDIAEALVAIPDVVYVVDAATVKELRFDPERQISWVSSSNSNQRAGCAGMNRPGEYFSIIGQRRAAGLHPYHGAEMKRTDLSELVMRVKALNLPGMSVEDVLSETIEPPVVERVAAAMKDLTMAGALDAQKNLTPLGQILSQLPVGVQVSRLMVLGVFFKCLDTALTLAAILVNRGPSMIGISTISHSWIASDPSSFRSDALAALRMYGIRDFVWSFEGNGGQNPFSTIEGIKAHLLKGLCRTGVIEAWMRMIQRAWMGSRREETVPLELSLKERPTSLLVALISAASQPNLAVRIGYNMYRTPRDEAVFVHPSSLNRRKKGKSPPVKAPSREGHILAFAEKIQDSSIVTKHPREFVVTTTQLDPMTYMLFGARKVEVARRGLECDEWLPMIGSKTALDQVSRLKEVMDLCFLRVCEGIVVSQVRGGEGESGDDGVEQSHERGPPLSSTEIEEFEYFTEGLVRILDRRNEEGPRFAPGSSINSLPVTPAEESRPATPVVESPYTRPSRFRGASSGGLRRTRSHSWSSSSQNSSISEGHQSPEDDGESKKKVDWYDEALSQSSASNSTSWSRTSELSMGVPGISTSTADGDETRPLDLGEGSTSKVVPQPPKQTSRGRRVRKVLSRIFSS